MVRRFFLQKRSELFWERNQRAISPSSNRSCRRHQMLLNSIREEDVKKQVGDAGIAEIHKLCKWLYKATPSFRYRVAPSIITRSECELFGISSPRFAIRKSVEIPMSTDGDYTLFNLRRLVWFCNAIERTHGDVGALKSAVIKAGLCVADSLIVPPQRFRDEFHIITCNLARYYGEPESSAPAVPFMQHMDLGGGMCAQACIFMALCLQEKLETTRISGVAELTAVAVSDPIFLLKGLMASQIAEVLRSDTCGLSAFLEWPDKAVDDDWRNETIAALRGYVESGVPVICLVDLFIVSGAWLSKESQPTSSIWGKNSVDCPIPRDRLPPPEDKSVHAVLLVGCGKTNEDKFLINDPAKYPFLLASFDDIYAARIDAEVPEFIPVLPRPITMPLIGRPAGVRGRVRGLIEGADLLQTFPDGDKPVWQGEWPGSFRLIDFGDKSRDDAMRGLFVKRDNVGKQFGFWTLLVSALRRLFGGGDSDREGEIIWKALLVAGRRGELPVEGWHWVQWLNPRKKPRTKRADEVWIWRADASERVTGPDLDLEFYRSRVSGVFERSGTAIFRKEGVDAL